MSKFLSEVSSSMVKKSRTTMLIKKMEISRLMVHAEQIEMANNKEKERENKRAKINSFNFTQPKSEGEYRSQFHPKSSIPAPSSASAPVTKLRDSK